MRTRTFFPFLVDLRIKNLATLMDSSKLSVIPSYPQDPMTMFRNVLSKVKDDIITMNLATIDSEFGILNRVVVYRGLIDDAVIFVTVKNTRKYKNLMENPKVATTFFFPNLPVIEGEDVQAWQVRLFDATATELPKERLKDLWQEEPLLAKIRSYICDCGAPVDPAELKVKHDQLLKDYQTGVNKLPQTDMYTAFAITGNRWDFWKTEPNKIADRVQYRKKDNNVGWEAFHVAS